MSTREERTPRTLLVHGVADEDQGGYWTHCNRRFLNAGGDPWTAKTIKEIPASSWHVHPWKAVEVCEPTTCIECLGRSP